MRIWASISKRNTQTRDETRIGMLMKLRRNGLTGEILKETFPSKNKDAEYLAQRVRRTNLQASLIAQVSTGIIKLNKKLESLENTEKEVVLTFKDGTSTSADLIVGGDGIRSVRPFHFPLILIPSPRQKHNATSMI